MPVCVRSGHHPEALLDQMALQRRVFAEVRDDFFEHVGIENGALHILRARIFAAFELQHLEAARGHGIGGGVASHAGPDDDRVEFFLDHCQSSCDQPREPVAAMRRQALAEGFGQRRQQPDRVGDDADMREIENRRVLVGVDRDDAYRRLRRRRDAGWRRKCPPRYRASDGSSCRSGRSAGPSRSSPSAPAAASRRIPRRARWRDCARAGNSPGSAAQGRRRRRHRRRRDWIS